MQNQESTADSELPSGGVYLHRDKNQIARSANLEASSGASGISASDCKGEGATSQFKPLPLNKKENTESKEVLESKEVKAKDSEKVDLESKGRAESAMTGDSERLESATDSESKRVISADFKIVDCHADKLSRNDKSPESQPT